MHSNRDMNNVLCLGYRCVCGERVEVARLVQGDPVAHQLPAAATVTCNHGHVATITADHFALLEHWTENHDQPEMVRGSGGRRWRIFTLVLRVTAESKSHPSSEA